MSQDPNQGRVSALTGAEAKTPAERAKQIQEMQRAMEAQQAQPVAKPVIEAQTSQKSTPSGSNNVAVFAPNPVEHAQMLKGPSTAGADQAIYGAKQADAASLFGAKTGETDIVPTGPIWKVIKFSSGEVLDLPKPESEYNIRVPPNAVKLKQGNAVQLSATPKAAGSTEPVRKKLVLVDNDGNLKGADWGSAKSLQKALESIPSFALSTFQSAFDGIFKHEPGKQKVVSVEKGTKSAYVVKLSVKNDYDGKVREKEVTLNNVGIRVPPSNDPRRHDIIAQMLYLDRFEAA